VNILRVRLYAILATFSAVGILLVFHAVIPPAVSAAPCCQECEDIDSAGYMCSAHGHTNDCTGEEACIQELTAQAENCWSHCVWCNNVCYDCFYNEYLVVNINSHRLECYQRTAGTCTCTDPSDPDCR